MSGGCQDVYVVEGRQKEMFCAKMRDSTLLRVRKSGSMWMFLPHTTTPSIALGNLIEFYHFHLNEKLTMAIVRYCDEGGSNVRCCLE
jgi:hypothetical protein